MTSVDDLAYLRRSSWEIYNARYLGPESLEDICEEVLSLHIVLKVLEEGSPKLTLSLTELSILGNAAAGSRAVLQSLHLILDKYNSLDTRTKRAYDQIGWDSKDFAELRSRLVSNTALLAALGK